MYICHVSRDYPPPSPLSIYSCHSVRLSIFAEIILQLYGNSFVVNILAANFLLCYCDFQHMAERALIYIHIRMPHTHYVIIMLSFTDFFVCLPVFPLVIVLCQPTPVYLYIFDCQLLI